ncbi:MAG: hypothetical protein CL947_04830 [Epsilonproteobacteria bacterium]|nr:hypothetical protein [Campylobacterota bacterium]
MTHKMKSLFFAAALACSAVSLVQAETSCTTSTECCSGCAQSQNLWQPHAFSVSMSREILLEKPAWEGLNDVEGWHGTFGVGFEYMRNFGENYNCEPVKGCCKSLGSLPFWAADQSNQMTIGDNKSDKDLDAYQLGLGPVETTGTVRMDPRVYQTGADFFLYAGAHKTERGVFFKIHGPVGVMSVDPRLSFDGDLEAATYPKGALDDGTGSTGTDAPYENIQEAFAGGKEAGYLKKMKFGKIDCKRTSSATFGDLAMAIGYNVYADETKHLGVAVRFSAPTGNKADGEYVLEPIFGRNGHWAAGGEIIGHWRAWESDGDDRYFDIWMNGTAEHLFRSKHTRSFDLKANGKGSKYLLLGKYTNNTFQQEIVNAVNVTTLPVESSFGVEGNFALMFDFHWDNWNFGLGYEGWGRNCEELKIDCKCPGAINLNDYAVLGRQIPLNAAGGNGGLNDYAEPAAKIGKSQDLLATTVTADIPSGIVLATTAANRIPSELSDAIDIDGQRAHSAYTSKVFAQVGHTWKDSDYAPYMGIMGAAEFTHKDNSAVRFWSVGLQGGLAF